MASRNDRTTREGALIAAFDVGGSHLKAAALTAAGQIAVGPVRVKTPNRARPDAVVAALVALSREIGAFNHVSIGFPGVVRGDEVLTAPNLGARQWRGFRLGAIMAERLARPVRMLNDASIQGLGVIDGRGLECVLTMGTGMGFALFQDGRITPHLELSQHPVKTHQTYDEYIGEAACAAVGQKHWNKRIGKVIRILKTVVTYDRLYIGGGNARLITRRLPADVTLVSNQAGLTGGARLWDHRMDHAFAEPPATFVAP